MQYTKCIDWLCEISSKSAGLGCTLFPARLLVLQFNRAGPRGGLGARTFSKNNRFFFSHIIWYCEYIRKCILGVHHKIGLYLGVISMHFQGLFLRSWSRTGDILWGAKISNIFGVLGIPDIFFFVKGTCWARAYVWRKKWEHPHAPPPPPTPGCHIVIGFNSLPAIVIWCKQWRIAIRISIGRK